MTDEPTADPPDQRDEHLAALLEVPPLDDVTRRRLVTTALEAADTPVAAAPSAPRGRRLLAVAAAVVAVVAVGAGVISALRNDDGGSGSTTAAGGSATTRATESGGAEREDRSAEAPASPAPQAGSVSAPIQLGELGDVDDTARLRATVRGALTGSRQQTFGALDAVGELCPGAAPPDTTPVATGTGRSRGAPVVVLVVAENLDRGRVLLLDPVTCTAKSEFDL